jgi:hypothetical protein
MAQLPDELFLDSLQELIRIDRGWVPDIPEDRCTCGRSGMYARGVPRGQARIRIPLHVDRIAGSSYFKTGVCVRS